MPPGLGRSAVSETWAAGKARQGSCARHTKAITPSLIQPPLSRLWRSPARVAESRSPLLIGQSRCFWESSCVVPKCVDGSR